MRDNITKIFDNLKIKRKRIAKVQNLIIILKIKRFVYQKKE